MRSVLAAAALTVVVVVAATHHSNGRRAPSIAASAGREGSSRRLASTSAGHPVNPRQFATGACETLPPTSGNRHLTVFLDAGHGGIDPGAVGTTESGQTVEEADLTLPVELDTSAVLRRAGFTVVVSRTAASTVTRLSPADVANGALTVAGARSDVAARAQCANEGHADLLVGIYFDAGASASNAGSVTGYDAVRPFARSNLRFARMLQTDVLGALNAQGWGIPDEGVLTDDDLGSAITDQAIAYGHLMLLGPADPGFFSTPSEMPGALIEPLFVTDPFEATIAAETHGQQVIAGGIAAAVEQYFTPPSSPGTTHQTSSPA